MSAPPEEVVVASVLLMELPLLAQLQLSGKVDVEECGLSNSQNDLSL